MKKIEKKPLLIAIALILIQSMGYLITKFFEGTPHLISNAIDAKIPFSIYAVIPYSSWFFLLIIVPYILYKKDKNSLKIPTEKLYKILKIGQIKMILQ